MKLDWPHLKSAIERGLNSARKGERGSMRVHLNSAERMLKGGNDAMSKEIAENVHHAASSIDLDKAVEWLEKAHAAASQHA